MQEVTVVIPAVDETGTLPQVLAAAAQLRPAQVIVVANGEGDGVAALARSAGAEVIRSQERLGYDIGRAVGAEAARGEALLFLDADLVLPPADLLPFLRAVAEGVDLALNRLDPYIHPQARLHPVNAAKRFLNCTLGRPDLGCASLTAVPHALSRRAVSQIGTAALAVPPGALAKAAAAGLRIEAVHPVDVIRPNARRPGINLGRSSPVEQLILGDHLEAIHWLQARMQNARCGLPDLGRRRELLPRG